MAADAHTANAAFAERVRRDRLLVEELPMATELALRPPRLALVTGATGFLGRYAVRELLARTDMNLVCPVRAGSSKEARHRAAAAFQRVGISADAFASRVEVLCGDLTRGMLGLAAHDYERLCATVDRVYHVGGLVNWSRNYEQLRESNVLGTLEVLRFALALRLKPVLFVSSISVCFPHQGPERVDERTPLDPHIAQLPFGYAQSKCVAESLVHGAAARGVPAAILRPALISGDSETGDPNTDDMLAALVEGCVASGAAIDADWLLDSVPVDYVASVLACHPLSARGCEVLHLVHDRPRHWREFVLWLDLNGYPTRLAGTEAWLALLDGPQVGATRLRNYRRFFQGVPQVGIRGPYQAFLRPRQERLDNAATREAVARLGVALPAMDGELFRRYLRGYERLGVLPAPAADVLGADLPSDDGAARRMLSSWAARLSDGSQIGQLELTSFSASDGILNEIAGARLGAAVGLRRARFTTVSTRSVPARHDALLKAKAQDAVMIALITRLASHCDRAVAEAFERCPQALGLPGAQRRELLVYELEKPDFQRFLPRCYGTHHALGEGVSSVIIEWLPETQQRGASPAADTWSEAQIDVLVRDLAALHAVWYREPSALVLHDCLHDNLGAERLLERRPLWNALFDYARPQLSAWTDGGLDERYAQLLDAPERWVNVLAWQRTTLIHNDFNPRNFVLRERAGRWGLCAFDWELATLGVPQRDLAELLCFVAGPSHRDADFARWLAAHRSALTHASGVPIDASAWRSGFIAALDHFLVERLPMYVVFHRFRPQAFLPRVVRNWQRLRAWAEAARLPRACCG